MNPTELGPSGWTSLLPARNPRPPADGERRVDVAIIGAGFTGLAVARRLAELRPADDIVVLEAVGVGDGASGRNSGHTGLSPTALDAYVPAGSVLAHEIEALRWLQDLVAQHAIACDMHAAPAFKGTRTSRGLSRLHQMAGAGAARLLSRDELFEHIGSRFYEHGLAMGERFILQPAALVRGLADSLPANVTLHEFSPVISAEPGWVVHTPRARFTARTVVLANSALARSFGVLRNRLAALYTYAALTDEVDGDRPFGGDASWGLTSLQRVGGTTVRRVGRNRLLLRSLHSYEAALPLESVADELHRRFRERYPALSGTAFTHVWGGLADLTLNGSPCWGMQDKGLWVSAGYNGHGITTGTILGKRLAESIAGHPIPHAIDTVFGTASWMPPDPLRGVGFSLFTSTAKTLAGDDAK